MAISWTSILAGQFFKKLFGVISRFVMLALAYRRGRSSGVKETIAKKTKADLEAMQVRQKHEDTFAKRSDDENRAEVGKWAKRS